MRQATPSQEAARDVLRRRMTATGDRYWDRYRELLAAHDRILVEPIAAGERHALRKRDVGAFVYFTGVDPTLVYDDYSGNFLICRSDAGQTVGIKLDEQGYALLGVLRRVRLELGFSETPKLDVAGCLHDTEALPAHWHGGPEADRPVVQLRALRAPAQLAVFQYPDRGPCVPGLAAAQAMLADLRAELSVPKAGQPGEILLSLLEALRLGDLDLFAQLWCEPRDPFKLRRRFEQFRRAYDDSEGRIAFERYKEGVDGGDPLAAVEVQMYVERSNRDGTVLSRPLTLAREAGGWRLKRGMI